MDLHQHKKTNGVQSGTVARKTRQNAFYTLDAVKITNIKTDKSQLLDRLIYFVLGAFSVVCHIKNVKSFM